VTTTDVADRGAASDEPRPNREVVSSSRWGRLYRGQTAIDFYGKRLITLIVAVVVVVVTILSLYTRGLELGLDFEGGNAWDVPASEQFGVDDAAQVLEDNGVSTEGARIQRRVSESADVVTIQVKELPAAEAAAVTTALAEASGVGEQDVSFSFTSSTWGSEITEKAIRALVIFLVIVSIFISIRFEWQMAAAAFLAVAHDVVATVGIYSLFQFEVTPATVIAFLTILGYSLYDTIIVFDRIKENEAKFATNKMPYADIVNISMNQVLMRSINTSVSSIIPTLSMLVVGTWILGAVALREFSLALLIGMLSGVYSSIFIAAPVLGVIKSRAQGASVRRGPITGDELRARVMGAGVSGRPSTRGADDAVALDRATETGTTSTIVAPADRLLHHPPRPRKKRR
jgi:preprotein translocase subunit SecF